VYDEGTVGGGGGADEEGELVAEPGLVLAERAHRVNHIVKLRAVLAGVNGASRRAKGWAGENDARNQGSTWPPL
jgi:hypothetical protein